MNFVRQQGWGRPGSTLDMLSWHSSTSLPADHADGPGHDTALERIFRVREREKKKKEAAAYFWHIEKRLQFVC